MFEVQYILKTVCEKTVFFSKHQGLGFLLIQIWHKLESNIS